MAVPMMASLLLMAAVCAALHPVAATDSTSHHTHNNLRFLQTADDDTFSIPCQCRGCESFPS